MNPTRQQVEAVTPNRRQAMITGAATVCASAAVLAGCELFGKQADVFVAGNQRYDGPLPTTIRDGLAAVGIMPPSIKGKQVLLKPNMVEPTRAIPYMTTHPAVVAAVVEVFLAMGARVSVGEAPGHVRDTGMALVESGIGEAISELRVPFADLNYEPFAWRTNEGGFSGLKGFYFPQSVLEADLIVSLPKLKTHHWMGMTAGMKNFYGVLPGLKYGWPKNVLHYNGIAETVVDINASLPPTLSIIDGIDCMEGDGPIMGSCKEMGLILVGRNLPALDATAARIIGLRPERIPYLKIAGRLGPIRDRSITQLGERWQSVAQPFSILDRPHLTPLRQNEHGPLVT